MKNTRWLLVATHLGCLIPAANLAWHAFTGRLSVNPIQDLTFGTGLPALILLILTLAVTPANTIFGWRWAIPLRRWFGLYAFFYALVHVSIFFVVDYGLDLPLIWETILEKPYVLAGLGAFIILLPLALTSTRGWQKRLGKSWKDLHRTVYLAALLAILHFVWLVKADVREPLLYGAVVAALLALRLPPVKRWLASARQKVRARLAPNRSAGRQTEPRLPENERV